MAIPGGTSIGGPGGAFPSTRWSVLREARDPGSPTYRTALDEFCRIYWKPIYAYVRVARPHGNEEAKDLTQEFLLDIVETNLPARYRREEGNFRTYLRGALRLFLLQRHESATAEKRGGGRAVVSLDAADVERLDRAIDPSAGTPDEAFDRQWAEALLDEAATDLREAMIRSGREIAFRVFERHDLNPPDAGAPSYAELASEFGIKETDVTNHLHTCRRLLREFVLANLREFMADEREAQEELQRLFAR